MSIQHYPNCRADYPEKPKGEVAQKLERMDLEDGEYVIQCVDCGAFEIFEDQDATSKET